MRTFTQLCKHGLIQGRWMGWLANHNEFYSFIIFHQNGFQIQSQEHRFSNFSWGHPSGPQTRACLVRCWVCFAHTLCELGQLCQTLTLNSGILYMWSVWENWSYLYFKFNLILRIWNVIINLLSVIHIVSKMSWYMQKSMRNSLKLTNYCW